MASIAHKPKSMSVGQRNVVRHNDSASLWNCTLSPGWSREEAEILRKAVMRFGIGNWKDIIESDCLPGKTNAQMNLQLQRLLGQQSTAEFASLHIDPNVIGELNNQKQGSHLKRKNGCIVNTGAKLSREEIKRRIQENKENYELPESVWSAIELPKHDDPQIALATKRLEAQEIKDKLIELDRLIRARQAELGLIVRDAPLQEAKAAQNSIDESEVIDVEDDNNDNIDESSKKKIKY